MIDGLSHVFLHLGLCNALAKAPPESTFALRVRMAFRTGDPQFNKVFTIPRGEGKTAVLEFDVPRGVYRVLIEAPKAGCVTSDFWDILPDSNRTIDETLADGPPDPPAPVTLMDGSAPISFLYVKPSFVLVDHGVACDKPIGALVPSKVNVEYDQGAYYVWLYSTPALEQREPSTVALQLRTPTGTAHYVKLPFAFPLPWGGFPTHIQMNVSEDMIAGIATDKTDTLLCPKLWQTSAH